jgi:hypothetical protein
MQHCLLDLNQKKCFHYEMEWRARSGEYTSKIKSPCGSNITATSMDMVYGPAFLTLQWPQGRSESSLPPRLIPPTHAAVRLAAMISRAKCISGQNAQTKPALGGVDDA